MVGHGVSIEIGRVKILTTKRSVKSTEQSSENGATTGYEAQLWAMADALRGSMDAAEYKHVVLGLLFLKYVSDAYPGSAGWSWRLNSMMVPILKSPTNTLAKKVFWVPEGARWAYLRSQARESTIGLLVDNAMSEIEGSNTSLKDVLPKDFGFPSYTRQTVVWGRSDRSGE